MPVTRGVTVKLVVAAPLPAMSVQLPAPCWYCHLATPAIAVHVSAACLWPAAPVSVVALGATLMSNVSVAVSSLASVAV